MEDKQFPYHKMMGRDGMDDDQYHSDLNAEEQKLMDAFIMQASELGINLGDPHMKELIKTLGSVEGELNQTVIDKVLDDQELEQNLAIAEVIVDGIQESTFAQMLNTRIQGDEDTLQRLQGKTKEELQTMLTEALARDIPSKTPGKSKSDYEEDILDTITLQYGSFSLKVPEGQEKRDAEWVWIRSWGLPGMCTILLLVYTGFMYYHYPESYTDYAKFEASRKFAQQSMNRAANSHEYSDEF